jgi:hypothetical protein
MGGLKINDKMEVLDQKVSLSKVCMQPATLPVIFSPTTIPSQYLG